VRDEHKILGGRPRFASSQNAWILGRFRWGCSCGEPHIKPPGRAGAIVSHWIISEVTMTVLMG